MKPATLPRARPDAARLLWLDPKARTFHHRQAQELPALLWPGDLLIVNDAATLPASLHVVGSDLELRLVRRRENDSEWTAVVFGAGDFRVPTEHRSEPRRLSAGEVLELGAGLRAEVIRIDAESPRLVDLRFAASGAPFWSALYRAARPVQYAYLERELPLWAFQNRFAGRPWALELPSAGQCLTWDVLTQLRARGVLLARLTHAAGISSTGSADLDRRFPLPERYEIATETVDAVDAARARGGRVVAVGTTVVRALEASFAEHGLLRAGPGEARLLIGPGFVPRAVDGVLSGMHERGTSHFALLEAFASRSLLEASLDAAERAGYLQHEFGDATLILAAPPSGAG
jgi:S-adenosylmethionine:tRNA ribosyltransferase-isomerase